MKLKNIAIAFLGALLFATCSKKDDEKEYTAEESKAVVRSTMDNFYNCRLNGQKCCSKVVQSLILSTFAAI